MFRIKVKNVLQNTFKSKIIQKNYIRYESAQHSAKEKPAIREDKSSDVKQKDIKFGPVTTTKGRTKLPKREPLVKNLFRGVVDKELLKYPEVISRDDTSKLHENIVPIKAYFESGLDTKQIDVTRNISKEIFDNIKNLGLFGLNIPQEYGGKSYCLCEELIATEPEQVNVDIASLLLSHRVVADVINNYGSDSQKNKYLPGLADGSIIATEAIFESKSTDSVFFGTKAENVDANWILNGEKTFLLNGMSANLFLVFAQANSITNSGDIAPGVTMFLVDRSMPGVKVDGPLKTMGLRSAPQCTLSLKDVQLTRDSIIGEVNKAQAASKALFNASRLRTGLLCTGFLKNITNYLTKHIISTKHNGVSLQDVQMLGERLSLITRSTYALESMLYHTSGLVDEFSDQDVDVEAAIIKLFALESLWKASIACMEFMGPKCLESGEQTETFIRNAAQLYSQGETLDPLRQFIGLSGLQHVGMTDFESIQKDRNPLFNPMHVFKKILQQQTVDEPKLTLQLSFEVHPSLEFASKALEESIIRLKMAVEILLTRHGNEVITKPVDVVRITECVTIIYAMFASISRASRSYCIGLQYSDYELLLASVIAFDGRDRIKHLVTDINHGPYITNDTNNQKIAKQLYKTKGYFSVHPLTYNF